MDIAIVSYRRFGDMPPEVYRECRRMGYEQEYGHLRALACKEVVNHDTGLLRYYLKSCLILYVDDTIVGWCALYEDRCSFGDVPNIGTWIKTKYRRKGYGTKLLREAYIRWNKYNPSLYGDATRLWKNFAIDANKS